jgi:hypothetical protein
MPAGPVCLGRWHVQSHTSKTISFMRRAAIRIYARRINHLSPAIGETGSRVFGYEGKNRLMVPRYTRVSTAGQQAVPAGVEALRAHALLCACVVAQDSARTRKRFVDTRSPPPQGPSIVVIEVICLKPRVMILVNSLLTPAYSSSEFFIGHVAPSIGVQ